MDSEQTIKGIMPVITQMMQQLQQSKPQPPMTPDVKVLLDTSMAETQRRAKRDEAEMGLKDKELAAKIQNDMAELQQRQQIDMEEMQLRLAIANDDRDMKERIETARLTRDAAKLNFEQVKAVPTQGAFNGNQ
jgi:thymidylate kinase